IQTAFLAVDVDAEIAGFGVGGAAVRRLADGQDRRDPQRNPDQDPAGRRAGPATERKHGLLLSKDHNMVGDANRLVARERARTITRTRLFAKAKSAGNPGRGREAATRPGIGPVIASVRAPGA